MPQKPLTPEILEVAENVKKDLPPGVMCADLVTTADGGWAIEVGLANREFPVPEIDEAAGSLVKVVYTFKNPEMVARPAYPKR
jgi:hypothetical protein